MAKRKIEITNDNIGSIIAALRNNQKLTVFDAAYKTDCSTTSIWKWEHDHTSPQISSVLRMCDVYNAKLYVEYDERW